MQCAIRMQHHSHTSNWVSPTLTCLTMLLLTQSTLFFRDLALNTRVQDVAIDGHVLRWKAGVTAVKSPATSAADTTSSAWCHPPSMLTFTTHSSNVTSLSGYCQKLQVPSNTPDLDVPKELFSDDVDNEDECAHTVGKNQTGKNGKNVVAVSGTCASIISLTWLPGFFCIHRQ